MSVDVKKLIEQVESRPPLWDRQHCGYFNKKLVARLWAEISMLQGVDQGSIKAKWKGLRDTFRLELRKSPQGSAWAFYKPMMFLRNHIKTRPILFKSDDDPETPETPGTPGTFEIKEEPPEDIPSNCVYLKEYEDGDQASTSYDNSETMLNDDTVMDVDRDDKDDDYHFLMSFLPEMRKLETKKKMLLRIKMMELFYKETYDPDYKN